MTTENEMPVEKRILHLLQHLGIEQAHFATGSMEDLTGLIGQHPEFLFRDVLTEDSCQCRGKPEVEDQFIAHSSNLFDQPEDIGIQGVWKTAPGGDIRRPATSSRSGWYVLFLQKRVTD